MQSVGAESTKTPPVWHDSQSRPAWRVLSGNPVSVAWLQVTLAQAVVLWHVSHSLPSLVSKRSSWRANPMAVVATVGGVRGVAVEWQEEQGTRWCAPSNGNAVPLWKAREALRQSPAVWQDEQSVPSLPVCGSWWHDAHAVETPANRTAAPGPAGNGVDALVARLARRLCVAGDEELGVPLCV